MLFAAHLTPVRRGRTVLRLWGYDATYIEPWVTARREVGDLEHRTSQTHATAADAAAWLARLPGRNSATPTMPPAELLQQALEWASLDMSTDIPEVRKRVEPQHEELGALCGPWLLQQALGDNLVLEEPLQAVRSHVRAVALEVKATVTWGQATEGDDLDSGLLVGTGWTGTVRLTRAKRGGPVTVHTDASATGGHGGDR